MGHRRYVVLMLLAVACFAHAEQGAPVYTTTGVAPTVGGSCTGAPQRVQVQSGATAAIYCCVGSTWANCTPAGGGGGAPTTAQYWTGSADGTLSAEHNLGALATGLVLNTAGTPSAYAGATCTAPNFIRVLSASGAPTCAAPTLALSSLSNPTGDTTFTFPGGNKILWTFSGGTDYAFSIHGDGSFTGSGDLVHLHLQGTPGVTAGADVLHVEWEDTDATGLRLNGPSAASPALVATGTVNITGAVTASSFSGPLTGAVTGNASTASALSTDPTACGANNYVTDISASGVLTCSVPPGTYSLPDATAAVKGGLFLTGDLGGTAASPAVVDDSHAHTTTTISGLDATNDFTAGTLPIARGGTNGTSTPTTGAVAYGTGTALGWSGAPGATGDCLKGNTAGAPTWGSCSAGGGYATVQDEAASLTQRTTLNFTGAGVSCADNSGSSRTDCTVSGAPVHSGLTAGGVMYATSTTAETSTGTGTSGRSTLFSGGTGAPTWVEGVRAVRATADQTFSSTTAAASTYLTWAINANEQQNFKCQLRSTSTATSKIRYAVATPTTTTFLVCRFLYSTTNAAALVTARLNGSWASTCTNCTPSVTASVLTTDLMDTLECQYTNGTNAGNVTIYAADSTAGQANILRAGSSCWVNGGG